MLPLVMLALTGTLLAQTPQSMPLTQPDYFHSKVSYSTREQDGDKLRLKNAKIEFEMGLTVTADEATFDKAHDGILQLSGNVQMVLKKK
jgi:hypothetical protein